MKYLLLSIISISILLSCTEQINDLPSKNINLVKPNSISYISKDIKHILPFEIQWLTYKKKDMLTIRSDSALKSKEIEKIRRIINRTEELFFTEFDGAPECNRDSLGPLEIRIINKETLRNKDYFFKAEERNFGRYFAEYNTLYIIPEIFYHHEYLAHELAHYYHDECEVAFNNKRAEHRRVYKFQYFYDRAK